MLIKNYSLCPIRRGLLECQQHLYTKRLECRYRILELLWRIYVITCTRRRHYMQCLHYLLGELLSGDELFSDTYKINLVQDCIYEVIGKVRWCLVLSDQGGNGATRMIV